MIYKSLLLLLVACTSCSMSSEEMPTPMVEPVNMISNDTTASETSNIIAEGTFKELAHETSGTVKVEKVSGGDGQINFTDFMTTLNDGNLRVWLAEDEQGTNYEVISMTVENGNPTYRIDANQDFSKKSFVLIWCEPAKIAFGSAELMPPAIEE